MPAGRKRRRSPGAELERPVREILRRRWRAGALAFLACVTPLASLVCFLPDAYRASAVVLIERQQIPDELVRSTVTSALETRLHTITQRIVSRPLLEALISRFGLDQDFPPEAAPAEVTRQVADSILIQIEGSRIGRDRTSGAAVAFTVAYVGRDPQKAAEVANALAASYVDENVRMREQEAAGTADFLRQQLEATKRKLEQQEQQVSSFKERHAGELPQQLDANLKTLEQLNAQLRLNSENQVRASEQKAALVKQLNEMEGMAPAGGPEAAGNRLLQLRQALALLQARYSEKYPEVIRVRSEIQALEAELRQSNNDSETVDAALADANPLSFQLRQAIDGVDVEIKRLRTEETNLRRSLEQYQQRVEMAPRREQESQALTRDYETTKELYRSLVVREGESRIAEDMEQRRKGEQFRVIEPALPPTLPDAPRRTLLVGLALSVAVVLATAVMLAREFTDSSFHSVQALRAVSRLPVVVSIPPIVVAAEARRRRRLALLTGVSAAAAALAITGVAYWLARDNWALTTFLLRLAS